MNGRISPWQRGDISGDAPAAGGALPCQKRAEVKSGHANGGLLVKMILFFSSS